MKAYVIKNKEGKYWCGNDIFSTTIDIRKTYICEDFEFINKVINKLSSEGLLEDCVVVSITIAEGDLEHKFEVYKEALKLACETIRKIMPNKPMYICGQAIADRLGIPMTSQIKDYEYFIEQAEDNIK